MKTLITKILAFSGLALLMLSSCKKDETKAIATSGTAPTLIASATNLTLTKALATNAAVNFSWSNANYGYSAAVTNVLQIDLKGNNFAKPKEVTPSANVNLQTYTVLDFNAVALSLGLTPGVSSGLEARVKSSIGGNLTPIYSNVVSLTVNPYTLISYVYVPGDYQGWNPPTADSLQSATSNGIYTGVINYPAGGTFQFKITPAKNWNVSYGSTTGSSISTSGGNITVPGAGSYQLVVDLNANTITITPMLWSIIGDATAGGWGADTDMKFNNGSQTWNLTAPLVSTGQMKFRRNHDWGTNYGGASGVLSLGGNNIPVPVTGTYAINLNLGAGTYTLTKQ